MSLPTVEEIGAKMDALGLWKLLEPYNFAVKPAKSAIPYFCIVMPGDSRPVKVRFLMLDGWQTLHDFIRTRIDHNFGFYSSPAEFPHYELMVLDKGPVSLFRHDTGFMPGLASDAQRQLVAKVLWEAYGVMMRIEADRQLPLSFASERAIFARVESGDGTWSDAPLEIPSPRAHVEKISFAKEDIAKAKDLPLIRDEAVELDFRLLPRLMTNEKPRPRSVYEIRAIFSATGNLAFSGRTSIRGDSSLRSMWEEMPGQVLKMFIRLGRFPGEIRVCSGRVFRMLRPLCMELPFRLSLHDQLPRLEESFKI